ncbi:hypothetical protein A2U01_0097704, partial [Trifolium medium]|nr:hypothetical protein [Trifolium medium]
MLGALRRPELGEHVLALPAAPCAGQAAPSAV